MAKYACIDIGGTAIKYGLADVQGNLEYQGSLPTELEEYGAAVLPAKIREIVEGFQQRKAVVTGVAISTAGMVDAETGEIIYAGGHFRGYTGMKLQEIVETSLGLPCTVENDVNCAGLGELWLGAGRGVQSMVCMTIGTGIGGCVILDGKLLPGVCNSAGEIGYMHIEGQEKFENLASASALVRQVAEEKGLPVSEVDGRRIFDWAEAGDEICWRAIERLAERLAMGIANVCYVVNPQLVILGGGIMARREYFQPILQAALGRQLLPRVLECTRVVFAERGNDAGMLGALYNFLQRKGKEE